MSAAGSIRLASVSLLAAASLSLSCSGAPPAPAAPLLPPPPPGRLRAVSDFSAFGSRDARAAALFVEATRVMLHPRCVNCHPSGDVPLQGDRGYLHEPPATRGPDGNGVVGMTCTGCHQSQNLELGHVPGAPGWHLAPRSMAWQGVDPHALCEQVKDPERNGGKTLAQIVAHTKDDALVAWGWSPGHGRSTPPGDQQSFGALIAAWAESGAACPAEGVTSDLPDTTTSASERETP
ncbi:MAG: Isoquinoline 1-oxidoreductase subunit [Myxococcales bacterium]|nr:Isoquinoline 1-oxidoreductase subunit [Myxococcales bacterium]